MMLELMERVERVKVSIQRDMDGVSKLDASCAVAMVLALPGIAWVLVANWDGLMAYLATL